MEITEVRIKLMDEPSERLKAFCSITFDHSFVVRDLKIIEGSSGPFVAMPSRKLTSHCPRCGTKNHLRANFCNQCGAKQSTDRMPLDSEGRAKLYADIAHPINSACREMIQDAVIREYEAELQLSQQPGYISRYDEYESDYSDYSSQSSSGSSNVRYDQPHSQVTGRSERNAQESGQKAGKSSIEKPRRSGTSMPAKDAKIEPPDTFGEGIFPEE